MQKQISSLLQTIEFQNKVLILQNGTIIPVKGNICLLDLLGTFIDIFWIPSKGNMLLQTSNSQISSYQKLQSIEIFHRVQFRHAHICPYKETQFLKSEKFYKPCACTLLVREDNHILVTKRKSTLNSFPGAWVLPGGHLQKGQGLLDGGLRQAEQQVGLNVNEAEVILDEGIMAWQSAYCVQNKIVSSSLVIFFSSKVKQFEVKAQQEQIEQFIWKDSRYHLDEHKYTTEKRNGYGEAHLNYLSYYRLKIHGIEEKKHWIQNVTHNEIQSNIEKN